ncbi:MAG: tyrosine--tRNA ligase [Spirochaetota bacterium]
MLLAKRLALAGHRPLLLIGSGTAKIGDPSGKTKMRKMLSREDIAANSQAIRGQLEQIFADCPAGSGKPLWLDNAEWLDKLNYIEFLRDIGTHFSVNRMLSFESYKQRMEQGLSFIEFNYQLLQSYDYLKLFERYDCLLQIGGDDQWGNMVSGIDLIRRYSFLQDGAQTEKAEENLPQVLTVPLVMTSSGKKMGKTEQGVVFIDPQLTSPFDFFQYWRNCSDADVEKFLLLFTFLDTDEIGELCRESGAALNKAKEVLAYEMCRTVHGVDEAGRSLAAAKSSFGNAQNVADLPGSPLPSALRSALETDGVPVIELYLAAGLCTSRNEARRLIQGGGAQINQRKITDVEQRVFPADLEEQRLLLKAGKKRFFCFRIAAT